MEETATSQMKFCSPCDRNGHSAVEGLHFCTNCKEYLCSKCLRNHKLKPESSSHQIEVRKTCEKKATFDFEFCTDHKDTVVEYFCFAHDSVFCASCKQTKHGRCEKVNKISDACQGMDIKQTFEEFTNESADLLKRVNELCVRRINDQVRLIKQKVDCTLQVSEISELRRELNLFLDKLEKEVPPKLTEIVSDQCQIIANELPLLNSHKRDIQTGHHRLLKASDSGTEKQKFVAMKSTDILESAQAVTRIENEARSLNLQVNATDILKETIHKLKSEEILKIDFLENDTLHQNRDLTVAPLYNHVISRTSTEEERNDDDDDEEEEEEDGTEIEEIDKEEEEEIQKEEGIDTELW